MLASAALCGVLGAGALQLSGPEPALAQGTLRCESGYTYALTPDGTLRQVAPDGAVTQVGTGSWDGVQLDALGIAPDGSGAYALEREYDSQSVPTKVRLRVYDAASGTYSARQRLTETGIRGPVIAGAVEPNTGFFWFGGFDEVQTPEATALHFVLFEVDPSAPGNSARPERIGSFDTGIRSQGPGGAAQQTGDMAFDAAGNLHLIRTDGETMSSYVASAADLAAHRGTAAIPVQSNRPRAAVLTEIAGAAFAPDGTVALGSGDNIASYDPSTWEVLALRATDSLVSSDLASCSSPPTLTIRQHIDSRAAPDDQFVHSISRAGEEIASRESEGSENGLQPGFVGPFPVRSGADYGFAERGVGGTDLSRYQSDWECSEAGGAAALANGAGTDGSVVIPDSSGPLGSEAVCTFTSRAGTGTMLTLRTAFENTHGGPQVPEDWALMATGLEGAIPFSSGETKSLPAGTYTIEETVRPGFALERIECGAPGVPAQVVHGGAIELVAGQDTVCTLVNRDLPGQASWQLTDQVTGSHLSGSEWELSQHGQPGMRVVDHLGDPGYAGLDTDVRPGYFAVGGLHWGEYELRETVAPDGYAGDTGAPLAFTVSDMKLEHLLGDRALRRVLEFGLQNFVHSANGDGEAQPLDGSEFTVLRDADGVPGDALPDIVARTGPGAFLLHDLPAGEYWLAGTRAPAGFTQLVEPVPFTVKHDAEHPHGALALGSASSDLVAVSDDGMTLRVSSPRNTVLPDAGGSGWSAVAGAGALLLTAAATAAFALRRRKTG